MYVLIDGHRGDLTLSSSIEFSSKFIESNFIVQFYAWLRFRGEQKATPALSHSGDPHATHPPRRRRRFWYVVISTRMISWSRYEPHLYIIHLPEARELCQYIINLQNNLASLHSKLYNSVSLIHCVTKKTSCKITVGNCSSSEQWQRKFAK